MLFRLYDFTTIKPRNAYCQVIFGFSKFHDIFQIFAVIGRVTGKVPFYVETFRPDPGFFGFLPGVCMLLYCIGVKRA